MKRYIVCLVAAVVSSISAWAVVASPEPFEYTRPDGTKVMARIYGDEFHSFIESLDGELLSGSRDAEVLEAAAAMRRARRISQAAGYTSYPTTGSPRSLVLLVGFSDLDFAQSRQAFQDLLTKSGYNYNGATGSCRDYYIASSDSLFSPQFDCYGPYKLSNTMEYYGGNNGDNHSVHAADMVAEACQMAHDAGVNFKDYDVNNDGILDNVFIFYAGHNEAEGGGEKTIWPHQSNIFQKSIRLDGVLLASYACTSEYKGSNGNVRCGVGTFCHEFGHVIGQPDFYDTDYKYYSVSNWDIMCSGSYNNGGNTPPTFSAYERMFEGWLTPKQLELPGQYTLTDIPFHKEAFLIAAGTHNLSGSSPDPSEFFLLDYRSGANGWDAALPGNGMIVWHIDFSASAWRNNTPNNGPTLMRMHMEEANGIGWKKRSNGEYGRSSDPYPGSFNVTTFTPTLHNGTILEQPIFDIYEKNGFVNFTYISTGTASLKMSEQEMELTTSMSDKKVIVDWEAKSFEVLGVGLDPNLPIQLESSVSTFTLYAGDEAPDVKSSEWQQYLTLYANADSTIQQRVWVNFRPAKKNCIATSAYISVSSAGTARSSMSLIGHSPRPTYVTTPETLSSIDITPYSFTARWKNVEDAERYYLTLYQIEDGETVFEQSFEDFDDSDKIRKAGWKSNTTLTTTSAKADGARALYFKNHGDQITSETYPTPITKLCFWYNAFTSSIDTIGVLELEAFDGEDWQLVLQEIVTNKAKKITATYEFNQELNYRAFRLTWMDNGGSGMALDAFKATAAENIIYLYKGNELALDPFKNKTPSYTFSQLSPENTYYYQVQCTDLDKGCEEHLTELSEPVKVTTIAGQPIDSKQLTLAVDSINYNPAQHAIYLLEPKAGDYLYFYNAAGRMVYSVPVSENVCIYALQLNRFRTGEVYMVQHATSGALGRKNKWLKFIY